MTTERREQRRKPRFHKPISTRPEKVERPKVVYRRRPKYPDYLEDEDVLDEVFGR